MNIIGKTIKNVKETSGSVTITFTDDSLIVIESDMTDESYMEATNSCCGVSTDTKLDITYKEN